MTERPIIFDAESIQAILDGRKSQTRRVIKPQPAIFANCVQGQPRPIRVGIWNAQIANEWQNIRCPYGQPGDLLWVRETTLWDFHGFHSYWADYVPKQNRTVDNVVVHVNSGLQSGMYRKRSSAFMPKDLARIWLEITGIRAERVQEIGFHDIRAEGWQPPAGSLPWFAERWNAINAKRGYSWESNPWAWIVEFRVKVMGDLQATL